MRPLQVTSDLVVLAAAFLLAYLLRFDFVLTPEVRGHALVQLPLVVLVQLCAVLVTGIYSFVWRYIGLAELHAFVRAAALAMAPILALRFGLGAELQPWRVPLSVILIDTGVGFAGLLAVRLARRIVHERWGRRRAGAKTDLARSVLVVGAGDAGNAIAREIRGRLDLELELVGFLDDEPSRDGSSIQGARVLGPTSRLPEIVSALRVEQVILADPGASRSEIRRLLNLCSEAGVELRVLPSFGELVDGGISLRRLREVRIEDLLGRAEVALDEPQVRRFLAGKRVMITGAGGSIGTEIAHQVARFAPASLLLVERAEFALFELDRRLARAVPELERRALIADVGDRDRMTTLLSRHRPQVVFHAAAHKHVPMMESNATEAIRNNVLATHALASLAGEHGVESFVLISSDKAVRPASMMGASKRLAEQVIQDAQRRYATRYLAVRFGNVLGSAGSVVQIFHEQIANGGPVTVTHPGMTRYFMTIAEAAQLVLQAGALGREGQILILDMGEPVRIVDLARDMIQLSGLRAEDDIEIRFTAPRPGEKLEEELAGSGEDVAPTYHSKIFVGKLEPPSHDFAHRLSELERLVTLGRDLELRQAVQRLLPEASLDDANGDPASLRLVGAAIRD